MCVCVWNEHVNVYVWDCSIGVSVAPPVTLRFPPMRRQVTSPLCFPTQEDLSKNVFLFKCSQQSFFLLCLAVLCVCVCFCTLVILYIVGPINRRCRWGCWRVCISSLVCTYIQSRILFHNTLWMWWGPSGGVRHVTTHFIWRDTRILWHDVPPTLLQSPLYTVTSGPDHISVGHKASPEAL